MLMQNRVTAIASDGSASPKTMEILAEDAFVANALSRLRQGYGGPRDNSLDVRYKSLALSPFTTLRHSAIRRLHASWQSNGTVAASD